jgi:hypothetical protein
MRVRLTHDYATREELRGCLTHRLTQAGNAALLTPQLLDTLCEHAAGNYRVLLTMGAELLDAAIAKDYATLDEKLHLEVFAPPAPRRAAQRRPQRRRRADEPSAAPAHDDDAAAVRHAAAALGGARAGDRGDPARCAGRDDPGAGGGPSAAARGRLVVDARPSVRAPAAPRASNPEAGRALRGELGAYTAFLDRRRDATAAAPCDDFPF